jgi:alpha amylase-like protein
VQHPLRPHPHLFEINTWAWLEAISSRLGREVKLSDVPTPEWDLMAERGFDVVWLMGVWQRSEESRRVTLADSANFPYFERALPGWKPADVIGSPYAVRQYEPDPRIGTWDDLDRAREQLRSRGIALFLDFVGNHTALDHRWTREHPEFYIQGTVDDFASDPGSFYRVATEKGTVFLALARDPYFPPWRDVAQLNHFNMQMRLAQIAELSIIERHCDGVRCDMAMLQLNDVFAGLWRHLLGNQEAPEREFWEQAHAAAPQLQLLAEAYWGTGQRLLDLGFSFAYDKEFYNAVRDMNVAELHARLSADIQHQSRLTRFLENHDEPRSLDVFGRQRLPSVVPLMGALPGMRLYYQGELEGCEAHLPIMLRLQTACLPDPYCLELFDKVLRITKQDVFHHGDWRLLPVTLETDGTFANLIAYEWRLANARKVIVVNLAGGAAQGRILTGDKTLGVCDYIFYDELHDVRYPRNGEELQKMGLFVRLEGFQVHLFDVTPAECA